jgi:hypothetical protein
MRLEPLQPRLLVEDYFSIIATLIAIGSIFLPWFTIHVNANFANYSSGVELGSFTGTYATGGILALTASTTACFMHFFRIKWAFLGGVANLLLAIGYLTGWMNFASQLLHNTIKNGEVTYRMDPQYGLYLFLFASIFQIISLIQSQRAYRVFSQ